MLEEFSRQSCSEMDGCYINSGAVMPRLILIRTVMFNGVESVDDQHWIEGRLFPAPQNSRMLTPLRPGD